MIQNLGKKLKLSVLLGLGTGAAASGFAQSAPTNLLDTLERGMWQFHAIGGGATGTPVNKLCIGNTSKLVQIQHYNNTCSQLLLRSSPNSVTINYSCRGIGQGTTTIRMESSKLIHIDSQGIKNNSPFAFNVEARMTGACPPAP